MGKTTDGLLLINLVYEETEKRARLFARFCSIMFNYEKRTGETLLSIKRGMELLMPERIEERASATSRLRERGTIECDYLLA